MTKESIKEWFKSLQEHICNELEAADGTGKFQSELWERDGGGGGDTRILNKGSIIEKGGVNFSAVHGKTPANILQALNLPESDFFATGVSIVLHPESPIVPIIHMNVRYFEMSNGTYWFGGGIDLTPIYVVDEDASYFHSQLKSTCNKYDTAYYDKFKKWADDYFFIKHRKETRGVGGIFFDRLSEDEQHTKGDIFNFVKDVGMLFPVVYTEIINRNRNKNWGENEKQWQKIRRGRYVEFNLVYDKGTKFGLDTDGRTESILMSLPLEANWVYNHKTESGSQEEYTLSKLVKGIDWTN